MPNKSIINKNNMPYEDFVYRHGDLLIRRVDELPEDLIQQKDRILAFGEATGHAHKLLSGTVFKHTDGSIYFKLTKPTELVHQEHKPIKIGKGLFQVIFEREFDPFSELINQVKD